MCPASIRRAERIITEELVKLGWTEVELSSDRKGRPAKLALAARLRRQTMLRTKEIAARLTLRTTKSATTALHRWMRNNPAPTSALNHKALPVLRVAEASLRSGTPLNDRLMYK